MLDIPDLHLQVPGDHIRTDARLAYAVGRLLSSDVDALKKGLESYTGSWRRSELVGVTIHDNLIISDYGHHPQEIRPTLSALRSHYRDKRLLVVFQPHQYSRTRELLDDFCSAFDDAHELYIPDIYFSRDSEEDVREMPVSLLIDRLRERYPQVL